MATNSSVADADSGDLFSGHELECIPSILPGETLFSWCSLYHRISGAGSAKTTSLRLFGTPTGGFLVDFPGRLDFFTSITRHLLGDTQTLISEHTLLSLYGKFRSPAVIKEVCRLMCGNTVGRLKFILGLPASRAGARHPLKFCKQCAKKEADIKGNAHWWVRHQWPSVWACERHRSLLSTPAIEFDPTRRNVWLLPSDLRDDQIRCPADIANEFIDEIVALAELTQQLTASINPRYVPEILWLVMLSGLREHGWISETGAILYDRIRDSLVGRFGWASSLPGLAFVGSVASPGYGFVAQALRKPRHPLHPSKYVVMIRLLFENSTRFLERYRQYASTEDIHGERTRILHPLRVFRVEELSRLVTTEGHSLNRAATILGVHPGSVISWAKSAGIEYVRRPRLDTDALISEVGKLISLGQNRKEIARTLNVRQRWISVLFSKHAELGKAWASSTHRRVTEERRTIFRAKIATLRGNPTRNLASMRGLGYRWLAKHDREWLMRNLPVIDT